MLKAWRKYHSWQLSQEHQIKDTATYKGELSTGPNRINLLNYKSVDKFISNGW